MAAAIKRVKPKARRAVPQRPQRDRAPVTTRYVCPRCGGAHPASACRAPERA